MVTAKFCPTHSNLYSNICYMSRAGLRSHVLSYSSLRGISPANLHKLDTVVHLRDKS
jgi:hypothetical protein